MIENVVVNYEYTNNLYKADKWLKSLPELFAADFEAAPRWTKKEKELIQYRLDNFKASDEQRRIWLQQLNADGLSHPALTYITHLSVAWSDRDAYVIVCDNNHIRNLCFNFLTKSNSTQIWHNSIFDFKHIMFHINSIPKNYIDTQLLSKCLLNDANPLRDRTSLKELMAYKYGEWAISKDDFILEEMWNPNTIKYSATDPCATYALYEDIQESLQSWKI